MPRTVWLLLAVCALQGGIIVCLISVIFRQQRIMFALGTDDLRRVLALLLPRWFTWLTQRIRSGGADLRRRANWRGASKRPEPASFVSKYE